MAFDIEDRIQVTDQSSTYRNALGTVMEIDADDHLVRIDGMQGVQTALFGADQLRSTSLPCPVDYPG